MDMHVDLNAVKEEQLLVEDSDYSSRVEFNEVVLLTDHMYAEVFVNGDWSDEVKPDDLAVVKQKFDEVFWINCVIFSNKNNCAYLICN